MTDGHADKTAAPGRQRCEVWTRVMGYHRPVHAFNPGKQSEHRDRCYFIERPGDINARGECIGYIDQAETDNK